MKTSELAAHLNAAADREEKTIVEIGILKTDVQALKDALLNIELPDNATAALTRLEETVGRADDLNPDVTEI